MNVSKVKLGVKAALVTCALAAAAIVVPASQATVYFQTTGGAACKGSSGFGAQYFYFSNTSVQNTTNIGQYVTCELITAHGGVQAAPEQVWVLGNNPTAGTVHYTCAVQAGYEGSTVTTTIHEVDVGAATYGYAVDAGGVELPTPFNQFSPYSLTCLVAPNAKIGLIQTQVAGTW